MSDATVVAVSRSRRALGMFAFSFQAQWIFYVVPAIYLFTNWLMLSHLASYSTAPVYGLLEALLTFTLPVGLIVMLVMRLYQYVAIERPESPGKLLLRETADLFTRPARIINGLPLFAAMVFFNKAMVELKPAIPEIKPFAWDQTFMALDRAVHFGVDPWVLLQPLMGYDYVTFAVNLAYDFWFVALFGAWFWFGFMTQASELRTRFFVSYMLVWWVGGGLLAVLFSSAGPVYYGDIGLAPDPYAGLMSYLHDVNSRIPIWALDTQKLLWDGYTGKVAALGISAFPSMHNASAVLFALAFRQVSRPLGWFFIAYAVVILAGSVHLGWHYAVDGYAGIGLAVLAWWVSGPIARWFTALPSTRRFNEGLASL
jgi:hypothetical protein